MDKKICKSCGKEKTLNDFYAHSGYKDKHLNICKDCMCKKSKKQYKKVDKNVKMANTFLKYFCRMNNDIYVRLPKKMHVALINHAINQNFFELAYNGVILPPAEIIYNDYKNYLKKIGYSEKDWIPFKIPQKFLFDNETVEKHYLIIDKALKEIGI